MSALGTILHRLVAEARVDCPASERLKSGLNVAVRLTPEGLHCLSLTRTHNAGPSRKEAETCADHLGWLGAKIASTTTRDGRPCLLVWPGMPQGAEQIDRVDHPAPPQPLPDRDTLIAEVLAFAGSANPYWAPGGIGHEGRSAGLYSLSDSELLRERARYPR